MRGSKLIRVTPGTTTHYQRLGVAPTATQPEIRAAYRDLARLHHPDVSDADADAAMVAVNEAWYVLRDPARRAAYDATMRSARPSVNGTSRRGSSVRGSFHQAGRGGGSSADGSAGARGDSARGGGDSGRVGRAERMVAS